MPKTFNVPANPAKAFFVDMITRDIELQDAILDLLDNCVDGVRRSNKVTGDKPYAGYYAHITFSEREFTIEDNCGGIPKETAERYAFMMGRPAKQESPKGGTIGVYGIGMKRAIFKMGRSCVVHSHSNKDTFEVSISKEWLEDDKNWTLCAKEAKPALKGYGTRIRVSDLHSTVSSEFAEGSDFRNKFIGAVRDAYSFLLEKGFEVQVNGDKAQSKLPVLLWDKSTTKQALRPYIYDAEIGGVKVFLAIGFREKLETASDDESDAKFHYRTEDAGWTIVCNDRVVLPYDKTRQTGWGWGGVASYHTQFIAITGFVIFEGKPADLPMTTTKRGVDANSPLYAMVRERMQEGMQLFTKFTHDWKGHDTSSIFDNTVPMSLPAIHKLAEKGKLPLRKLKGEGTQRHSLPHLPERPKEVTDALISFRKPLKDIKAVSRQLFEEEEPTASEVGSACFDFVLRRLK